ncbi:MAG: SOS response-associated peptidase [Deltaproteobacteria bacterium]|nr:SOS response-associated peptidase [Deltaproteobacteria bacterium]
MCGRYTLKTPADELAEAFDLRALPELEARWNVSPSQLGLVVPNEPLPAGEDGAPGGRGGRMMRWGLMPSWLRGPPKVAPPVNARAETIAEKPYFRGAFRHHRCLVLCDGYYEWHVHRGPDGRPAKTPFYLTRPDGGPMAFAGLWQQLYEPNGLGGLIESYCLITTTPNADVAPIHDRMPVLLDAAGIRRWLGEEPASPDALHALLRPAPDGSLVAWAVSNRVNSPRYEGPELIAPLAEPFRTGPRQGELFE